MPTKRRPLERMWDGRPVVDAKRDLRLFIRPSDFAHAVPGDPQRCVLSRTCKRVFGGKVLFARSRAYVELPDDKGRIRVERFVLGTVAKNLIREFDQGGKIVPEGGFTLTAPNSTKTLEEMRKRSARLKGERKKGLSFPKPAFQRDPIREAKMSTVRNLKGLVHFSRPTKIGKKKAKQ